MRIMTDAQNVRMMVPIMMPKQFPKYLTDGVVAMAGSFALDFGIHVRNVAAPYQYNTARWK